MTFEATGMPGDKAVKGLYKFILLWNESLGSWEDQMGVRSQFENKTDLLSYKDMLMGREQRYIKETKETGK